MAVAAMLTVIYFAIALSTPQNEKRCPLVSVRDLVVSSLPPSAVGSDPAPVIKIVPSRMSTSSLPQLYQALRVILDGPVVDSTNSIRLPIEINCTDQGLAVTANLSQSADYALQNVPWRPRVELELLVNQAQARLVGIEPSITVYWTMSFDHALSEWTQRLTKQYPMIVKSSLIR